jgi:putative ABC transport system ATP-binding protein
MQAILELDNIGKSLSVGGQWLFKKVSAVVDQPVIIHLIGSSGQGKSSLLRILGRLDAPDEGDVSFNGTKSGEWDPRVWRRKIGYVSQQPVMIEGTVLDNLRLGSMIHHEVYDARLGDRLLRSVGLEDLSLDKRAADLSGGEKQRISLIRSMLLKPQVLLLDEVTSSLDARHVLGVELMLSDWHRSQGTTLIWVTHNTEQARRTGTRIWFMAENALLEDRATEAFFREPVTEAARQYLHAAIEGED